MSEPWVCFEDEHLLVVSKPSGVNTHQADAYAQDGMYEWAVRCRGFAPLSILHRLDKGTSGLLVFGRTPDANRSLTKQFEERRVTKRYELLVPRDARRPDRLRCDQPIGGADASTDFERLAVGPDLERWVAHPHTGRTHQVRLHAAALGMPILGDDEHGGAAAPRLFLHAAALGFDHPVTGPMELAAPPPASFDRALSSPGGAMPDAALAALVAHEARALLFDPADTDAYLWIDRHHDGFPGVRVERLGDVALVLNYDETSAPLPDEWLDGWNATLDLRAVYEQRRPRRGDGGTAQLVSGAPHPRFEVTELGLRYLIDLEASATSSGLFLDQRETRRRLLTTDLTGRTVLNAFAHTGSLSAAAAAAGAETLTLDLSRRYLDWARDNLRRNGIDPDDHDFVYGDAMDWMKRFAKKGRTFDMVILDPPSASTSRGAKRWTVERDLYALVARGVELCAPGGTMFVSTNLHRMTWPRFMDHIDRGLAPFTRSASIGSATLPLDHRTGPGDPPYLKAAWITLDAA